MEISEKVAYLKGLAEGLALDTESKEGKLIAAIIDVLDDMSEKFSEIDDELCDVEDGVFCLRRGTFPVREKYPKARQNQGFGILSGRQEGAVGRSLNFESSAVLRRCR